MPKPLFKTDTPQSPSEFMHLYGEERQAKFVDYLHNGPSQDSRPAPQAHVYTLTEQEIKAEIHVLEAKRAAFAAQNKRLIESRIEEQRGKVTLAEFLKAHVPTEDRLTLREEQRLRSLQNRLYGIEADRRFAEDSNQKTYRELTEGNLGNFLK